MPHLPKNRRRRTCSGSCLRSLIREVAAGLRSIGAESSQLGRWTDARPSSGGWCAMHEQPTVLIVDDVDATRSGLGDLLRLLGYAVHEARNGVEALKCLEENPEVRVVVLDLLMPGSNGYWFRERQLKNPAIAAIPVIVFTGSRDTQSLMRELRVAEVLQKPVAADVLCEIIRRYCEK
jgi:CheY-like chemotaxis protein